MVAKTIRIGNLLTKNMETKDRAQGRESSRKAGPGIQKRNQKLAAVSAASRTVLVHSGAQ